MYVTEDNQVVGAISTTQKQAVKKDTDPIDPS